MKMPSQMSLNWDICHIVVPSMFLRIVVDNEEDTESINTTNFFLSLVQEIKDGRKIDQYL